MVYHFYVDFHKERSLRVAVVAPDVEYVDDWWRSASKTGNVKRLAADLFVYKAENWFNLSPSHQSKFLWTYLWSGGGPHHAIVVNPPRSEPISGRTFYIRAKNNPRKYWYVTGEGSGRIYASPLGQTRFRIRIDGEEDDTDTYMLSADKIVITKATDPNLTVSVNNGELWLSERTNLFSYGDLKNRFLAQGEFGFGGKPRDAAVVKQCDVGVGEEWELVA